MDFKFISNKIQDMFTPNPPLLGLDISDSSLKYIQLQQKRNNYSLSAYGERKLPSGLVEEARVKNPDKLSEELKEALNNSKNKNISKYIAASLPDEEVFLKKLQMPRMNKEELKNSILVEAERNIPVPLKDAYLDFNILPDHNDPDHMDVLLTVARKEVVDGYVKAINGAGLIPVIIEPEVIAISRSAIADNKTKGTVIIAEIGANRTRFIAFVENSVILTSAADFSAEMAQREIKKALGLTEEEARNVKWTSDLLTNKKYGDKIEAAMEELVSKLADELIKFIDFLQDREKEIKTPGGKPDKILLSGGGSRLPGIHKFLATQLKVSVETVNPWVNILPDNLKETPEISEHESIKYTTAIGLALNKFVNIVM